MRTATQGSSLGGGENHGFFSEGTVQAHYMDYAVASIAARYHLPVPTARVIVELAKIGGGA